MIDSAILAKLDKRVKAARRHLRNLSAEVERIEEDIALLQDDDGRAGLQDLASELAAQIERLGPQMEDVEDGVNGHDAR